MDLNKYIRSVPDFPQKGVLFRDITPLLAEHNAYQYAISELIKLVAHEKIDRIAAIESRGFLFGAPIAVACGVGIALIRKKGKLPYSTVTKSYELEYGENTLELHSDALIAGERILIVDDVLATGGTAQAAGELVRMLGGEVVANTFLIELIALNGRKRLSTEPVYSLLQY
jgi:adenine phosphoribosyltransferase